MKPVKYKVFDADMFDILAGLCYNRLEAELHSKLFIPVDQIIFGSVLVGIKDKYEVGY